MHGLPIGRTTGGAPITRKWKANRSWWDPQEAKPMAAKFVAESGSYDKSVPDSGDGQSKAKFSNPIHKPTDDLPKPSSKANPVIDSKDSKVK